MDGDTYLRVSRNGWYPKPPVPPGLRIPLFQVAGDTWGIPGDLRILYDPILMYPSGGLSSMGDEDMEFEGTMDVEDGAEEEMDWDDLPMFDAAEVYRSLLLKAWEDDVMTEDEYRLLRSIRLSLRITAEEHRILEEEVVENKGEVPDWMRRLGKDADIVWDKFVPLERLDIYHAALKKAWEDAVVTKDELGILKSLQSHLDISSQEHDLLETKVRRERESLDASEPPWIQALRSE